MDAMGDGLENVVYPFKKGYFGYFISMFDFRGLVIDKLFGSFGHNRT